MSTADASTTYPKPTWWSERTLERFENEDDQSQAKVKASAQVLGFLLNVSSDSGDGRRFRSWFAPEDFPGAHRVVAEAIWTEYDGDVEALVMRLIAGGQARRTRNGVLVTDMYWNASLSGAEEAAFVLSRIRQREREYALAATAMSRLLG